MCCVLYVLYDIYDRNYNLLYISFSIQLTYVVYDVCMYVFIYIQDTCTATKHILSGSLRMDEGTKFAGVL